MKLKTFFLFMTCISLGCGSINASTEIAITNTVAAQPNEPNDLGVAAIQGQVLDAVSGAPLAGATIICQHQSVSSNPDETCNRTTTSDQNGAFSFEHIRFNTQDLITLHIEAEGYQGVNIVRGFPAQAGIDLGEVPLTSLASQPSGAETGAGPTIANCPIFPANNFWNTPIDALPTHPQSAAWTQSIGAAESFHMDFGSGEWDGGPIGIPYNVAAGSAVPKFEPEFYYPDESDAGPYPIPENAQREWGSDHHILTIDTETCTLYEIYDASLDGATWSGGSGAIWDLNSNALRPDTWTSADAAGLPILPGLVRYDEILAGEIKHALRFTAEETAGYVWPARHQTSDPQNDIPPMGARFRLKAGYDLSGFPPEIQVLLQAMKTYGIVLADNGSNWYVSGAPDSRWDNDTLHLLDVLTGNDFEAVDTSALMINMDSGEAAGAP
ncbi:MAG: carboxypeptidase regulatory-like domain-containing protein [Anaerolineales bacterium]|nr:carboxypeptidase regulatory-like domain-containing protein [Anaerolineales bacterium]